MEYLILLLKVIIDINPITLKNGDIKLETSKIQIKDINGKLNEIKNMDLSYKLFEYLTNF